MPHRSQQTIAPSVELPPELWKHIFELAAEGQEPHHVIELLLVAHRLRTWLEPRLYESVTLDTPQKAKHFWLCMQHRDRPIAFFQTHVKRLLIRMDEACLYPSILTSCTAVHQLTILPKTNPASALFPIVENLQFPNLTHLNMTLDESFGIQCIRFDLPIFQRVTHLRVNNTLLRPKSAWNTLAGSSGPGEHTPMRAQDTQTQQTMPKLTHMAMRGLGISAVPHVLAIRPQLTCVAFERHLQLMGKTEISDPRFVRTSHMGEGSDNGGTGKGSIPWWRQELDFWANVEERLEAARGA